jgi:hypothetical protein
MRQGKGRYVKNSYLTVLQHDQRETIRCTRVGSVNCKDSLNRP